MGWRLVLNGTIWVILPWLVSRLSGPWGAVVPAGLTNEALLLIPRPPWNVCQVLRAHPCWYQLYENYKHLPIGWLQSLCLPIFNASMVYCIWFIIYIGAVHANVKFRDILVAAPAWPRNYHYAFHRFCGVPLIESPPQTKTRPLVYPTQPKLLLVRCLHAHKSAKLYNWTYYTTHAIPLYALHQSSP